MTIHHLKPDPSSKIAWSKGTSTELFIYPQGSNFQSRDFLFRISLATVEAEESEFTPLPGIQRSLMLLKGKHTLIHKDHHSKTLFPFDQDAFSGDWQTTSQGKATNFNLMCRQGAQGQLEHIKGLPNEEMVFDLETDFCLLYLHKGQANYNRELFQAGEFLVIEKQDDHQLILKCKNTSDFVQVSISLD